MVAALSCQLHLTWFWRRATNPSTTSCALNVGPQASWLTSVMNGSCSLLPASPTLEPCHSSASSKLFVRPHHNCWHRSVWLAWFCVCATNPSPQSLHVRLRVPKRVKLHETYGSRTPSSGRVGKTEFAQRFFLKASMGYPQAPLFSGSRTIAAVSCIKQLFLCLLLMSAARVHVVFREVAMHVCSKTKMPFLKSRCRIVWRMCARRLRSLII